MSTEIDDWSAALPGDPLSRHAMGPHPRARLGWTEGASTVGELGIEPPDAATLDTPLHEVAERMRTGDSGMLPLVDEERRLVGAVYIEGLLARFGVGGTARDVATPLVPTSRRDTPLCDALREMLNCRLRRLPILDEQGRLLGQLPITECVAAADRDPRVRDLLSATALSPSLWAKRWR